MGGGSGITGAATGVGEVVGAGGLASATTGRGETSGAVAQPYSCSVKDTAPSIIGQLGMPDEAGRMNNS